MIKDIRIRNFRAFKDTTIEGFEQVNLITGKNNVGKSALLEALWLMSCVEEETIFKIQKMRGYEISKIVNDILWQNLFFNPQEKRIYFDYSFITHMNNFISQKCISYFYLNNEMQPTIIENGEETGVLKDKNQKKVSFISATEKIDNEVLALLYDGVKYQGYEDKIIAGFKSLDKHIENATTLFLTKKPHLYVKTQGNKTYLPINFLGDAINKLAVIILTIIDSRDGLVLIDEIENGIHYTRQSLFWEIIFKLAIEFNVQVFATTHSKEMIEAFQKVVTENKYENAMYFELLHHPETADIVANRIPIHILTRKILIEKPYRGEE